MKNPFAKRTKFYYTSSVKIKIIKDFLKKKRLHFKINKTCEDLFTEDIFLYDVRVLFSLLLITPVYNIYLKVYL